MKKILSLIIVLCLLISAASAEIDLSSMTIEELNQLRNQINEELNNRKPVITETEEQSRREICDHFQKLANNYAFQSIIDEINSGDSGLSTECQTDMLSLAKEGVSALDGMIIESDIFSGNLLIKSPLAENIGGNTAVVPYLDKGYLGMIVGFQYDDLFSYDEIMLKVGEDIHYYSRKDFDIEIELIDGDSWEYTYLTYVSIPDGDHLEAVGFRENDTTRKVDHIPTEAETQAVDALARIDNLSYQLHERVLQWQYHPDASEQ